MFRLRRVVRTVERSLKKRGVVGSAFYVGEAVARRLRKGEHDEFSEHGSPAYADGDAAADQDFDARYGVSTGGEVALTDLDVKDKTWIHGSAYVPTSPVDFSKVLAGHGVRYEDTTFIDLGSGKGRVLLMAAALPFKRIVGVEFSAELADISRDNIRKFTGPRACSDISVETMDASKYVLPEGPVVVFMYHPFDDTVMAMVEASVTRAAAADKARRIVVVYFKPVHRELWDRSPAFSKRYEEPLYVIYESRPPVAEA